MYNNYPSDGTKKICTVTAIDLKRKVCKCMSDLGEILTDVRWLIPTGGFDGANASSNPVENSKVLVDVSSGFPFILGAIYSESTSDVRRPNIGRQDVDEPDISDYTTIGMGDLVRGPGTPRDQRPGDTLVTSEGGAIQGVLGGGTVINKASPLSQIICSRFGDMVRVVSRNYEHMSESGLEQQVSIRGSIYSRNDMFKDPLKSRDELPTTVEYSGNVQLAELVREIEDTGYDEEVETTDSEGNVTTETVHRKYTYASIPVDLFPATPADDGIINKTYVYNDEIPAEGSPRIPVVTWTRSVEGVETLLRQTTDELTKVESIKDAVSTIIQYTTEDSESTFSQDATSFHVDITDTVSVDGNAQGLVIHCGNADDSVLTEIRVNSDGTLEVTTTGNVAMDVGGDFNANVTGATNWTSGGDITFTAPTIHLND